MLDDFPQEPTGASQPQPAVAILDDFVSEADLPPPVTSVQPERQVVHSPVASRPLGPGPQHVDNPPRLQYAEVGTRKRAGGPLVAAAVLGLMFGSIAALRLSNGSFAALRLGHFGAAESPAQPTAAAAFDDAASRPSPDAVPPDRSAIASTVPAESSGPVKSSSATDSREGVLSTTAASPTARPDSPKPADTAAPSQDRAPTERVAPSTSELGATPSALVLEPLRDSASAEVAQPAPPARVSPPPGAAIETPLASVPAQPDARPESAAIPVPPVTPATPPAMSEAPAAPATIDERPAIDTVLGRYRTAYSELDARAVKQVWPTASESALTRAFANLESQNLAFYQCETTVAGATARAACDGQVSYVGRVGPRQPRTQNRQWTFTLKKTNAGWEIERVQIR